MSPFHAGEQAVQERMGVREQIEPWARRVVRPYLPEEHRQFYGMLPFVVAAARDPDGLPWATLLSGAPGFIESPDRRMLDIDSRPAPGDALAGGFGDGADVGLLGIELASRRRNRVNGRVASGPDQEIRLAVDQSFGNCPQFIHPREWHQVEPAAEPDVQRTDALSAEASAWIEAADTLFIATGHRAAGDEPSVGMDASHRGGDAGFVRVVDGHTLVFPDYTGNNHFNTVGNLVEDPRVGLLFVDFASGSLLQLTGRARIDWDSPLVAEIPGAERLISIEIDAVVIQRDVLPLRWLEPDADLRALQVTETRLESDDVLSVVLEASDGRPLPDFRPGQHLPLLVSLPGHPTAQLRTYSLAAAPDGQRYRLGIRKQPQGRVSGYLHKTLSAGETLSARLPAGDFVLNPGERGVMLVSAGVGITPMLAMLEAMVAEQDERPIWFVHGARDGAHHPFRDQVRKLTDRHNVRSHVSYSRPRPADQKGRDWDHSGRISAELVTSLRPELDVDYYFCGPVAFMSDLISGLAERGVPAECLRFESFGPTA